MRIIIAGAGAVGTHLAKMLSDERHDIVLMDPVEERLTNLESNFDLMTMEARPTSISSLKEAGVADADLFVAVTYVLEQEIMLKLHSTNLLTN